MASTGKDGGLSVAEAPMLAETSKSQPRRGLKTGLKAAPTFSHSLLDMIVKSVLLLTMLWMLPNRIRRGILS
jgi:hypothetical protein